MDTGMDSELESRLSSGLDSELDYELDSGRIYGVIVVALFGGYRIREYSCVGFWLGPLIV